VPWWPITETMGWTAVKWKLLFNIFDAKGTMADYFISLFLLFFPSLFYAFFLSFSVSISEFIGDKSLSFGQYARGLARVLRSQLPDQEKRMLIELWRHNAMMRISY
jgi:hypothetical protein